MKNALLIGFFTNDPLIRETYNAMKIELSQLGFSMQGLQPEGEVSRGYQFPTYSFRELLSGKRISKIRKALCILTYWLSLGAEKSYAEMQIQGSDRRAILNCLYLLTEFRIHLTELLASREIKFVILNHQFSGFHLIAKDVCRSTGIPIVFWHPGFLPGTMSFDREGQMAESEINATIEKDLPTCGEAEEKLGELYRNWCMERSYVRPGKTATSNTSSVNELIEVMSKFKNILLVIGSNDYRTGMLPRSYRNSYLHSKLVRSSSELYLMAVTHTDENTLVIYKPHPNLSPPKSGLQWDSARSLRLFDVAIRDLIPMTTACVTLCSGGAYETMLFGLPTVVIGEIPGSRAGICYALDPQKPDFSGALSQALCGKQTSEMKSRFNILVGFLLKKYFFASGTSACPLVENSMRDALIKIIPRDGENLVKRLVPV